MIKKYFSNDEPGEIDIEEIKKGLERALWNDPNYARPAPYKAGNWQQDYWQIGESDNTPDKTCLERVNELEEEVTGLKETIQFNYSLILLISCLREYEI